MLKKGTKKIWARIIAWCLVLVMLPISGVAEVFAATTDDTLTAALTEAKTYIDYLTINNTSNDPSTVVSNYGTHFTWDNEKRESGKSYLYDWSYYNGVVFEGLEYVYEKTKEETYKDYVTEYMSSMINADGTWATCSNNSSKECAGYVDYHGADCYKTASLLLDAYEMTGDSRYLTMAEALYADLDEAAESYLLANAGNNYHHTWPSASSPNLCLDGLYMILPFRAEYANYIGDTDEIDLIVDRLKWVSDNMYDGKTGYFYHAANSATDNSGTFWLRSIGWYAAALVDVMDSVGEDSENLTALKTQLLKLVDGMKATQNSSNGMWLNNLAASKSSSNPYETSGTALVCYAVMKAVNNGWLDESYADMAILAFEGICNKKLEDNNLTDICFKGAPGSSNNTFYDNEGKGVGPFIMLYAEVLEYVNNDSSESEPEEGSSEDTDEDESNDTDNTEESVSEQTVKVDDTEITVSNIITDTLKGNTLSDDEKELIESKAYNKYVAYDLTATLPTDGKATISIPVPAEWNASEEQLIGISVEDGTLKEIKGSLDTNGNYSFEVEHFSAKGVALLVEDGDSSNDGTNSVTGTLKGTTTTTYELVDKLEDGEEYLIVSGKDSGAAYALGSTTSGVSVDILSGSPTYISNPGRAVIWTASGSGTSWSFNNGSIYLGYTRSSRYTLNPSAKSSVTWTVDNNLLSVRRSGIWGSTYYITSGLTWSMSTTVPSTGIYFYHKVETTIPGSEVGFTL